MEAEMLVLLGELENRLSEHDEQRKAIQARVEAECARMHAELDALADKVNSDLEKRYVVEDERLQKAVIKLREALSCKKFDGDDARQCVERARAELLVVQTYSLVGAQASPPNLSELYELSVSHGIIPKTLSLENRRVRNFTVISVVEGCVFLSFDELFSLGELQVLKENGFYSTDVKYSVSYKEKDAPDDAWSEGRLSKGDWCFCPPVPLRAETDYVLRVRVECSGDTSAWSEEAAFTAPSFEESCSWRPCPDGTDERYAYFVDPAAPRVATRISGGIGYWATVVGNVVLPAGKLVKWNVRLLKSRDNGRGISVGVAPCDISTNAANNGNSCGWYFNPQGSTLRSGPPHHFNERRYNSSYNAKKGGDVEVLMNTATGELSFAASGKKSLGVAYKGIPLDKPLIPWVLIYYKGDSVELFSPVSLYPEDSQPNQSTVN